MCGNDSRTALFCSARPAHWCWSAQAQVFWPCTQRPWVAITHHLCSPTREAGNCTAVRLRWLHLANRPPSRRCARQRRSHVPHHCHVDPFSGNHGHDHDYKEYPGWPRSRRQAWSRAGAGHCTLSDDRTRPIPLRGASAAPRQAPGASGGKTTVTSRPRPCPPGARVSDAWCTRTISSAMASPRPVPSPAAPGTR
ncbi:hypothetical protein AcdelDRAFT_0737 [Acidovorax delafieldii 2AN]|uniref:Uncharacterized protein n=1 Tax=Acidovorax delafieldii 2AN TaxID=573060 RepID=C5T1F7_ACIDE|nr:hypothetical protein AcdelDRAFT_0737 [Acidovorax delafieldii 2AN]